MMQRGSKKPILKAVSSELKRRGYVRMGLGEGDTSGSQVGHVCVILKQVG